MNIRVRRSAVVLALVLIGAVACGGTEGGEEGTVQDTAMAGDTSMMGMQMSGTPGQDGHHEFLRMMSSHHEGLIRMASAAMDKAQAQTTKNDAHQLHQKQAMERDSMVAIIQRDHQEHHQPMPMPKNVAQADSLNSLTGREYDRTFYRMVIDHHREGIRMTDQHMANLTKPEVRQMAEKMKADQQREIAEFERKMQAL